MAKSQAERRAEEAAAYLRALLAEIEAGRLAADTPRDRAIVHRIQGAVDALEGISG